MESAALKQTSARGRWRPVALHYLVALDLYIKPPVSPLPCVCWFLLSRGKRNYAMERCSESQFRSDLRIHRAWRLHVFRAMPQFDLG